MSHGSVRPPSGEGGTSLVEVLVASWILASAVAAVAQCLVHAGRAGRAAQELTYATVLATQKMEELRAQPRWLETAVGVDYANARAVVSPETGADAYYERQWTIEPSPVAPDAVAITVVVARAHAGASGALVRLITLRGGSPPVADGGGAP